jgi:DNA polymerase III subunit delta'
VSADLLVPGQPLAERILRGALAGRHPPQQLLLFGPAGTGKRAAALEAAWRLMDPEGAHPRTTEALDLTRVEASGQQILLRDVEEALARIATRPTVMRRRVMIVHDIERLRENESRLLKTLEEPPPLSHIILVTAHPADLLPTIRSRCLPVPFRSLGWREQLAHLGPFEAEMRRIGVDLALAALRGGASPAATVQDVQRRMEAAAGDNESDEVRRLKAEAAALEGKRGGRTAQKRAEDQEKRERRRMVTDGWTLVLESAATAAADALAVAVGAESAVRNADQLDALRAIASPERIDFLGRAVEEIGLARAELELNPTVELAGEALLVRIDDARHGAHGRLIPHGRLAV